MACTAAYGSGRAETWRARSSWMIRKQCGKGDGEALEATLVGDKLSMADLCPSRWRHRSTREPSICHPALVAGVDKMRVL